MRWHWEILCLSSGFDVSSQKYEEFIWCLWTQRQPVHYHIALNSFDILCKSCAEACFSSVRKYHLTGWKVTGTIWDSWSQVWWQLLCGTWLVLWEQKHYYLNSQERFGESHAQGLPFQENVLEALIYWQSSLTEIPSGKTLDFSLSQKVGEQLCKLSQRIYF